MLSQWGSGVGLVWAISQTIAFTEYKGCTLCSCSMLNAIVMTMDSIAANIMGEGHEKCQFGKA